MRWLRAANLDTLMSLPEGYWPVLAELVKENAQRVDLD